MDIFLPIVLIIITLILFSICGWCCKKKREGTVYGYGPPATAVTVTTHHVPGPPQPPVVNPPYPVNPQHPAPQPAPPPAGFAPAGATPYPPTPAPYPPMNTTPYPPPGGAPYPTGGVPYSPPPNTFGSANPPPYHEVVSQPPPQPLTKEGYSKQAPYNPNY